MSSQPTPPATDTPPNPPRTSRPSPLGKLALAITATLFIGWLGWLAYTSLTKSRAPVVSRAQAAAATVPVVAELTTGEAERGLVVTRAGVNEGQILNVLKEQAEKPAFIVTVVEPLHANAPTAGTKLGIHNLPNSAGYTGPGKYLLLLNREPGSLLNGNPVYTLVGQQRSPGSDLADVGPPRIYAWTDQTEADLRKQVSRLFAGNP